MDKNYYLRTAQISHDGKYRHTLQRVWDSNKPTVMFMMLNPSTADAEKDDPTIRRCINFAKSWGYGSLYVGNLYDYRSTDPRQLLLAEKPFSSFNESYLQDMAHNCDKVIAAWGNNHIVEVLKMKFKDYLPLKKEMRDKLYYLDLCKGGECPKHPLYLKKELTPIKYKI